MNTETLVIGNGFSPVGRLVEYAGMTWMIESENTEAGTLRILRWEERYDGRYVCATEITKHQPIHPKPDELFARLLPVNTRMDSATIFIGK